MAKWIEMFYDEDLSVLCDHVYKLPRALHLQQRSFNSSSKVSF